MKRDQAEIAATNAINARLAEGFGSLSVDDCRLRYGAAFDALVSLLRERSANDVDATDHGAGRDAQSSQ